MENNSLVLFALNACNELGNHVADCLGLTLSSHEEREFDDGEHKTRSLINVRGKDCYVIQSLNSDPSQSVHDKLCRLLFFIAGLKDAGAKRVTAIVPYLAYARKDHKSQARDPVATRYIAQLFEAVGTDTVVTIDVHNVIAYQNAFRCHAIHLEAGGLLSRYIATRLSNEAVVVVSPDIGGIKRAEQFRQRLSAIVDFPVSMAVIEKYRSEGKLSGSLVVGEVSGRKIILIDDLISSGQTLVRAAIACRNQGALSVTAMATHGLFVHDAVNVLGSSVIDQIVTSDSVMKSGAMVRMPSTKFERLSCADLLAQTITRLHNDGSIVDLMAR